MSEIHIFHGDCRTLMKSLPAKSVHCCVTSPPYWTLRDYGTGPDQIGMERSASLYIDTLVKLFREVRRVLRDDGTLWLNVGDTYQKARPRDVGGERREEVCKRLGVVDQRVGGKLSNEETHRMAAAAEELVCQTLGRPYHGVMDKPDGRADLYLDGKMADVKWLGARDTGYLIKPNVQTWADLYILVAGQRIEDLYIVGWTTADHLRRAPRQNFGHGLCHAVHMEELRAFNELVAISGHAKPKDLVGIPWLLALALRADGWYLRQEIIWSKPCPMPENVTDRCSKAHENVFLLTKEPRYFIDMDAIRVPHSRDWEGSSGPGIDGSSNGKKLTTERGENSQWGKTEDAKQNPLGSNQVSVWTIAPKPFKGAHFAIFPSELAERCILAGTSAEGCCSNCGTPWTRIIERNRRATRPGTSSRAKGRPQKERGNRDFHRHVTDTMMKGWKPGCSCGSAKMACTVLDPFLGSGTTAAVSQAVGCNFIGYDVNLEYVRMARHRVSQAMFL